MPILDTYSKRRALVDRGSADPYVYNSLPAAFRVQASHIIENAIGKDNLPYDGSAAEVFQLIDSDLAHEFGQDVLTKGAQSPKASVIHFIRNSDYVDRVIDVIELSFRIIDNYIRNKKHYSELVTVKQSPQSAIDELNERFKSHGLGFQFVGGKILRIDDEFSHAELTLPAIRILLDPRFANACEEFLTAHDHYRHGRLKECLVSSLASFESVMKIICDNRGWTIDPKANAKHLINVIIEKGFIAAFMQEELNGLRMVLTGGVPTLRNTLGGHGQGSSPTLIDTHYVHYALNMTASAIIFLEAAFAKGEELSS